MPSGDSPRARATSGGLPEARIGEGASKFAFLRGTRYSCDASRFGRFVSFDSGPSTDLRSTGPGSGGSDAPGDASRSKAAGGDVPREEETDGRRTLFVMKKS